MNLSDFFVQQAQQPNSALYQGANPNSIFFDPTKAQPVPQTALAASTNPSTTGATQALATPPAPPIAGTAAPDSARASDNGASSIGQGTLDPMAPQHAPQVQPGKTDNTNFVKNYTQGGGGGGLLKLLAAFM